MSQGTWRVVRFGVLAAATTGLFLRGTFSPAANIWDGAGGVGDSNWGTATNWDNNLVPTFPAQLTFAGTTKLAPSNNLGNVAVDGIIFDNTAGAFSIGGNAFTLGDPATADNRRAVITNNDDSLQTIANNITLSRGQHHISTKSTGSLTLSGSLTRATGSGAYFAPLAGTSIKTTLTNNAAGIIGAWAVIQNPTPTSALDAAFFAKVDGSGNVVPYGNADYLASGGGTPATDFDIDGNAGVPETTLPSAPNLNTNVRWRGSTSTGLDLTLPAGTTDMHTFLYDAPQGYGGPPPIQRVNGSEAVQIGAGNVLRFASGGGIFRSNNTGDNGNPTNDAGVVFSSNAPAVVGDYSNNGTVDAADYVVWREALLNGATALTNRDPSQGAIPVDQVDYDVWKAAFGKTRLATITAGNSNAPAELVFWTNTQVNTSPSDPGDHHNRMIEVVNTVITDNPNGGVVTVVKNGPGAVRTTNGTASHSFSGGLYLNRGVWRSDNSTGNGWGTGPVHVASGAQAFPQTAQTINNNFFISGTGIDEGFFHVGAIRANNAAVIFNGTITLTGDSRLGARGGQATAASGNGVRWNGKITGNFKLELNVQTDQGTTGANNAAAITQNTPSMILNNPTNDWGGDTTIGTGRIRVGANEVIPDGPGKGNLILLGQPNTQTPTAAGRPSILSLDGRTETINGLSSAGTLIDPINGIDLAIVTNHVAGTGTLRVGNNNATSNYGGSIIDDLAPAGGPGLVKLVKIGSGDLTLSGENSDFNGGLSVEGGRVIVDPPSDDTNNLGDNGDISIATGSTMQLDFTGADTIRSLILGGVAVAQGGEWGSAASGAAHPTTFLTGLGKLFVTVPPGAGASLGLVPEPGTMGLLMISALFGVRLRPRRRFVS